MNSQNSDKLSCGKMIKWFMLNFAEGKNARSCQSGSWEQMSYSSWGQQWEGYHFPSSSHHWQPRFSSWRMERGLRCEMEWIQHCYSISQVLTDMRLPWIFVGSIPELLMKHSIALPFAEDCPLLSWPSFEKWPLVNHEAFGIVCFAVPAGGVFLLAVCAGSTLIHCPPAS